MLFSSDYNCIGYLLIKTFTNLILLVAQFRLNNVTINMPYTLVFHRNSLKF
jgi:hypothetical protein